VFARLGGRFQTQEQPMRRQFVLPLAVAVIFLASHALRGVQNDVPEPAAAGKLAEMRQARVAVATAALEQIEALRQAAAEEGVRESLKERGEWQSRLAHAEFEAAGNDRAARLAAAERHFAACRKLQAEAARLFDAGHIPMLDRLLIDYRVVDAECKLAGLGRQ
jgi:hypothetical protein